MNSKQKICPKTGKIIRNSKKRNIIFTLFGLSSLIWFLIRVIPKPSRAAYPCMKVAAPIASGFVIYLVGLLTTSFVIFKARNNFKKARYIMTAVFVLAAMAGALLLTNSPKNPAYATSTLDEPNTPIGTATGIYPGRVVWVHNPDANNENCTNKSGDYWWMDKNNNQNVIDQMLSQSIQSMTGKTSDSEAWDALFRYYNQTHGKGDVGYTPGEKVIVKINLGCEWSRNNDRNTYIWKTGGDRIDSTPHLVLSMLKQLANKAGIPQENIGVGDPIRHFSGPYWDLCHGEFPNIEYWDIDGKLGRTKMIPSDGPVLFYSDGEDEDYLPKKIIDADYMINMPCLKAHARAGITIGPKNHFGSHCRASGASHLHRSLPCPNQDGNYENGKMGSYRCFVDIMGHEHLGGKTMLYVVDGIWGAGEAVDPPNKWHSAPFNEDWPASLILSQDAVAIESVCFDFLYEEYDEEHYSNRNFPYIPGTQDYMHQAADPANWPEGINYDPENDGSVLTSLGVHEHWNNPVDKLYSRNLGTGEGIELIKVDNTTFVQKNKKTPVKFGLDQNFPNPFNPHTTISYELSSPADVQVSIYNLAGQKVTTLVNEYQTAGPQSVIWTGRYQNGSPAASGVYVYRLSIHNEGQNIVREKKMLLLK